VAADAGRRTSRDQGASAVTARDKNCADNGGDLSATALELARAGFTALWQGLAPCQRIDVKRQQGRIIEPRRCPHARLRNMGRRGRRRRRRAAGMTGAS